MALQYSMVGVCSGPLQKHLRSSRALEMADERIRKRLSASEFARAFPHDWLFITVRYGCADFYGRPTVSTDTTPTREWKLDERRNEFVAVITLDGSSWEVHDKEQKHRQHLNESEIARQIVAAVVPALSWIARVFHLPDSDVRALKGEIGTLPAGAKAPEDLSEAEIALVLEKCSPQVTRRGQE